MPAHSQIVAYTPPYCENDTSTRDQQKNVFFTVIFKMPLLEILSKLVILADMNAPTDLSLTMSKFDRSENKTINYVSKDNGERLIN